MKTVLVTVDTSRMTMDLEVPAEVPISHLLPVLATVFAQHGEVPPAIEWGGLELLRTDATPLARECTLSTAGIVDGDRLTLSNYSSMWQYGEAQVPTVSASVPAESSTSGGIGIRWNKDSLFKD